MCRTLAILFAVAIASLTAIVAKDTSTGPLSPRFKSVQVWVNDNDQAPPVLFLNGPDRLVISFDELAEERSYLRYFLTHCNAQWQPDGLVANEFLDGFNDGSVEDYDYSRGTTVHYVNYRITIPNEDMRPTISGNYLLEVYEDGQPDKILLQVRFYVAEGLTVAAYPGPPTSTTARLTSSSTSPSTEAMTSRSTTFQTDSALSWCRTDATTIQSL